MEDGGVFIDSPCSSGDAGLRVGVGQLPEEPDGDIQAGWAG